MTLLVNSVNFKLAGKATYEDDWSYAEVEGQIERSPWFPERRYFVEVFQHSALPKDGIKLSEEFCDQARSQLRKYLEPLIKSFCIDNNIYEFEVDWLSSVAEFNCGTEWAYSTHASLYTNMPCANLVYPGGKTWKQYATSL